MTPGNQKNRTPDLPVDAASGLRDDGQGQGVRPGRVSMRRCRRPSRPCVQSARRLQRERAIVTANISPRGVATCAFTICTVTAVTYCEIGFASTVRLCPTTRRKHVIAEPISSSVVYRPRLNRTVRPAAASVSPIALNTCDGVPAAELQAEVEETASSPVSMNGKKLGKSTVRLNV